MYLCSALHGHGDVALARRERRADRVHAGHERRRRCRATSSTARPMRVMIRMLTTTYGRVGDLDADVRDRAAERAHRERDDVHRAAAHAAVEEAVQRRAHLARARPSCWSGPASSSRSLQMNVRSSTRATSDGSEQREEAVGPLRRIEPAATCPLATISSHSRSYSSCAAVAPDDAVGLRQRGDLAHPAQQARMADVGGRADRGGQRRKGFRLVHRQSGGQWLRRIGRRRLAVCARAFAQLHAVPHPPAHPLSWTAAVTNDSTRAPRTAHWSSGLTDSRR